MLGKGVGCGQGVFGLCLGTIPDDFEVGTFVSITCMKCASAAGQGLLSGKLRDTRIREGQEHAQMGREAWACWVRMLCMHA